MRTAVRTIVYVDGFKREHSCLKGTSHRRLDRGALCSRVLRDDGEIVAIKYFTARVTPRPGNLQQAQRWQTYLRALATTSNLSVHFGHFITRSATRRLVDPPRRERKYADVWVTEEKGSDANLASHLLIDGFRAPYDLAVVVSNDGDLKEPVQFVRHDLGAPVGVLNPHRDHSWALSPRELPGGSSFQPIRPGALPASQFPRVMRDATGEFHKPSRW